MIRARSASVIPPQTPKRSPVASAYLGPETVAGLLVNGLGIPTVAGRASAIRQHVLEMPAPVVADALGYHPVTTAKLASQAGGTWSRYAAGDHQRSPSGWTPRRTHDS